MNPIVIWFAIGVACMAGELFTASFVVVFFGAGAWAAALVAAVHPGPEQELAAFLLVSLASLLFLRRRLVTVFRGNKADASATASGSGGAPEFVHTGAFAEVTKDIPANVVAVGNPCRVMRDINEHDREYYYKNRKIPSV